MSTLVFLLGYPLINKDKYITQFICAYITKKKKNSYKYILYFRI